MDASQIREHMPVIGSDGQCVGTIDKVEENQVKLTKNDSPDELHHYLPLSLVQTVDEHVLISLPANEAMRQATTT